MVSTSTPWVVAAWWGADNNAACEERLGIVTASRQGKRMLRRSIAPDIRRSGQQGSGGVGSVVLTGDFGGPAVSSESKLIDGTTYTADF